MMFVITKKGGGKEFSCISEEKQPTGISVKKTEGREVRAIIEVLALLHWTHHASTGIMAAYREKTVNGTRFLVGCLFKTLFQENS